MIRRLRAPGGYWYLPAIRAYSAGVAADDDHELVRVVLRTPEPMDRGMALISKVVDEEFGRPIEALCAVELRSPRPMSYGEFSAFNRGYTSWLDRVGITAGGHTPVARTNVVPALVRLAEPVVHGFTLTVPAVDRPASTFVTAGAAESKTLSARTVVGRGETSVEARMAKCSFVTAELRSRLTALEVNAGSAEVTIYAESPPTSSMVESIVGQLSPGSSTVVYCCSRPPVAAVEFEMDVRRVSAVKYL